MRRLPVYLLLDTSESMAGESLEAVQHGLESMLAALRKNPHALETVWMSVITFDSRAKVVVPLTDISEFQLPKLSVKPATSFGAALQLLAVRINKEVVKTTVASKGDYRPLVFLLTDGQPTDRWQEAVRMLKDVKPKIASIYAIGCGQDVDYNVLAEIGDAAYHIWEDNSDLISKFFVWMTASVQSMSQGADSPLSLEKSPFGGFDLIDPYHLPEQPQYPLQVFLHSQCMHTKKHYLMRYQFVDAHAVYLCKKTHVLPDDFYSDGTDETASSIPSDLLYGSKPCPYCASTGWGQCGNCGQISCNPDPLPPEIQCPKCKHILRTDSDNESFAVGRAMG